MEMVPGILGILVCIHFILISNAQPEFLDWSCADVEDITYPVTANSTYLKNLNTLLSNLSSNTQIDYGFYNFSYGQDSDRVNVIGLCRGDVKLDACLSCLNDSKVLLTQLCQNQKLGIGWYDNCMLRYSNNSIFNTKETYPREYTTRDSGNTTDVDEFNPVLKDLLNSLANQASLGDSRLKFSAGNASGPGLRTIFGLVQCTPDLSRQDCSACLVETIADISECCNSLNGATYLKPSCNIRYEIYPFYELNNLPISPSQQPQGKSNTSRTIIAIVVPIIAFVILVNLICIYFMRRSRKHIEAETLQMDFATIMAATNNFSDANKLGKGGFGPVYQGRLSNGQEVAVKRLSMNSLQGDTEFKNEVLLVAKLQHRNLVKLLGFCLKKRERLLVYEFVPNKSLDFFIFDQTRRAELDWETRYKIIRGIARGLLYLHEDSRLRIIHRDLKASNILLDAEMHPKISDFGMARLFEMDQTQANTSRIVGTYGYMAPEYVMYGHFSVKSDVFSFGVLVLEIVSGQKNSRVSRGEIEEENEEGILSSTWQNWREATASNIVDPTIIDGSRNEITRCIHVALLCVQENVADRPTMASVALMINSYSVTLPMPSQPGFSMDSLTKSLPATQSDESNIQSGQASVADASITEPFPR